jgi:class 3 adenylate cyclase/cytochrome b subunit of formate dehydrogenase
MSVESKQAGTGWLAATLCGLTLILVAYWSFGPPELAPWRMFAAMMSGGNMGTKAKITALAKATPQQQQEMRRNWTQPDDSYMDKLSVPDVAQLCFLLSIPQDEQKQMSDALFVANLRNPTARLVPVTGAERAFTRFVAVDALAATALALVLLGWRRRSTSALQLALTLGCFALALACFLVNGQARLRGEWFAWPSWSRLLSDVIATLAFGGCLLGFERFFSNFPVPLEDWQVVQSQLRWRGRSLSAPKDRPWYLGGRENLIGMARKILKLTFGILLAGTVASTLPALVDKNLGLAGVMAGAVAALVTFGLVVAFGWLLAASLFAKLRAGRENCTEKERRQADWLFAGGLVMALMLAVISLGVPPLALVSEFGDGSWLRYFSSSMLAMFFPAGWAVMLLALAGAVFLSETFGPKPLLKRTVLVAAAGVLMSLLLAIVQHLVTAKIFSHASAAMQSGLSTGLAGGIAVFSLGFFRVRLERGIDGFLNRFMPATVIADGKRRDATVVFSDLAGYTALSAADEPKALLVAGHFQKVAGEVARRHGGRIVKTIGDAVMWVFATPAAAFAATLELSAEFRRVAEADKLPVLPVNSGVHYGSVVEAPGGDVYGAAVNLASRLQGAAKDGAVVASMEAVQEVAGGFRLEPLGKLELKNVPVPVACFRVALA